MSAESGVSEQDCQSAEAKQIEDADPGGSSAVERFDDEHYTMIEGQTDIKTSIRRPVETHSAKLDALLKAAEDKRMRRKANKECTTSSHYAICGDLISTLGEALELLPQPVDGDRRRYTRKEFGAAKMGAFVHACDGATSVALEDCWEGSRENLEAVRDLITKTLSHPLCASLKKPSKDSAFHLRTLLEDVNRCLSILERPVDCPGGMREGCRTVKIARVGGQDMEDCCLEHVRRLTPPLYQIQMVERIRGHLESLLRLRWQDASLLVFGSSAGQLALPSSDIDLALSLPSRALQAEELNTTLEHHKSRIEALTKEYPDIVAFIDEANRRNHRMSEAIRAERKAHRELTFATRALTEKRKMLAAAAAAQVEQAGAEEMKAEHPEAQREHPEAQREHPEAQREDAAGRNRTDVETDWLLDAIDRSEKTITGMCERHANAIRKLNLRREAVAEWRSQFLAGSSDQAAAAEKEIIDCRTEIESASRILQKQCKIVFEIAKMVRPQGYTQVMPVHRARVPVVKMTAPARECPIGIDPPSVDITINNLVAVHNTALVTAYTQFDDRCHKVLYLVKNWAKVRGVSDSSKGELSSYGHCIAALHYLQMAGVVPSLLKPRRASGEEHDPTALMIGGIDVSLCNRETPKPQGASEEISDCARVLRKADAGAGTVTPKDSTVCALLTGYFSYFVETFHHGYQVATLRPECVVRKQDAWEKPKLWRTSIEDPFETYDSICPHDLGQVISRRGQRQLHREWARGLAILRKGGPAAVEELFEPVEVQDPKPEVAKAKARAVPKKQNRKGRPQHEERAAGAPQGRVPLTTGGGRNTEDPQKRGTTTAPHLQQSVNVLPNRTGPPSSSERGNYNRPRGFGHRNAPHETHLGVHSTEGGRAARNLIATSPPQTHAAIMQAAQSSVCDFRQDNSSRGVAGIDGQTTTVDGLGVQAVDASAASGTKGTGNVSDQLQRADGGTSRSRRSRQHRLRKTDGRTHSAGSRNCTPNSGGQPGPEAHGRATGSGRGAGNDRPRRHRGHRGGRGAIAGAGENSAGDTGGPSGLARDIHTLEPGRGTDRGRFARSNRGRRQRHSEHLERVVTTADRGL